MAVSNHYFRFTYPKTKREVADETFEELFLKEFKVRCKNFGKSIGTRAAKPDLLCT